MKPQYAATFHAPATASGGAFNISLACALAVGFNPSSFLAQEVPRVVAIA